MILTGRTLRLIVDNQLRNLTKMVDDQVVFEDMALQMMSKMELVVHLHESLF
jgi:hypothetical protein